MKRITLPDAPDVLTPAQTGAIFRVGPKTLARWEKAGKITSTRTPGGHRRYARAEIERVLNAGANGGRP